MTQGIERLYAIPGSKAGITVALRVWEQYDPLQNLSDLTLGLEVKSSQYAGYTYYLKGSLGVDGTVLVKMASTVPTHYVKPPAKNTYDPVKKWSAAYSDSPWKLPGILHNTDGTKTVTVTVELTGYTTSGSGGSGWNVSVTQPVVLTPIPRACTLAATDANIGAVSMVAVTRRSSAYTHSVAWQFGSLSGYLGEDGSLAETEQKLTATAIPFRLPESFYDQIPDSPTGVCTLTCRTWNGDTQIGSDQQAAFTVTADKSLCGPTLSCTVSDMNNATVALTGDRSILVLGASTARCTLTAAARNGASLVSSTVNGTEVTQQLTIPNFNGDRVDFACTDSRGYTASQRVRPRTVAYFPPVLTVSARRTDPTGDRVELTLSGRCFTGSFGYRSNGLTLTCAVNGGEPVTLTPQWEGSAFTLSQVFQGLDYRSTHSLTVTAADRLSSVTATAPVGKGVPVFDWGEGDFAFHVPVTAPSLNGFRSIPLAAYPEGAIYASLEPTDPAAVLGGSWEQLQTELPFYLWARTADSSGLLGTGVLGMMILGKE